MSRAARILLLLLLAQGGSALAVEYHHQTTPMGARAAQLAGAFTALSRPISAWYNPAGLGFLEGTRFWGNISGYGTFTDRTEQGGGFRPLDSGKVISFGLGAASVWKLGEGHFFGLMFITPEYGDRSARLVADASAYVFPDGTTANGTMAFIQEDRDVRSWLGFSYAYRAHRRVSVGATLLVRYRSRALLTKLQMEEADQVDEGFQVDLDLQEFSFAAQVGVRIEPVDGFFVGAVFRTGALSVGRGTVSLLGVGQAFEAAASPQSTVPWRAALGLAYERPRSFAVSLDLSFHGALGPKAALSIDGVDPIYSEVHKRFVVNTAVGAEYYIDGRFPIRLGFYTDRSAQAEPRPEVPVEIGLGGVIGGRGRVQDFWGVTGGFGWETRNSAISLGISYLWGSAESVLGNAVGSRYVRRVLVSLGGTFGI